MRHSAEPQSTLSRLGWIIEQDIHTKALVPGQPYLTAKGVAQMLGVHERTANRAMNLLVARGLLTRKPGAGTFIGPGVSKPAVPSTRVIHLLTLRERLTAGFPMEFIVEALAREIPDCSVRFDFIPPAGADQYVRAFLDNGHWDGDIAGLLLSGCPAAVRTVVFESRIPAVVFGSAYKTAASLPTIDRDQLQAGRLEARYLVGRGHRKMLFTCLETWLPGDNLRLDGVNEVLAQEGIHHGSLVIRSLPADPGIIERELQALLSPGDRPTGLMCHSHLFADAALAVAHSLGLKVPGDLDIVFDDYGHYVSTALVSRCVRVRPDMTDTGVAALVARTLKACMDNRDAQPGSTVLPVRLIPPPGDAGAGETPGDEVQGGPQTEKVVQPV